MEIHGQETYLDILVFLLYVLLLQMLDNGVQEENAHQQERAFCWVKLLASRSTAPVGGTLERQEYPADMSHNQRCFTRTELG